MDSPRKFPRRSTAKWMHPGAPSGFRPPVLIPMHKSLSPYVTHEHLTYIIAVFLPLDQPITCLSIQSIERFSKLTKLYYNTESCIFFQKRHLFSRWCRNIPYGCQRREQLYWSFFSNVKIAVEIKTIIVLATVYLIFIAFFFLFFSCNCIEFQT